jgi:hypothetical protein
MTAPRRAAGLFLSLTNRLSGIFWVLMNASQTVKAATGEDSAGPGSRHADEMEHSASASDEHEACG